MQATQQLRDEHEGIMLMLRIINGVCRQLASSGSIDQEHFERILEFLKIFVDKCHHGKEEEVFFPALVAAGIPHDGPIAAMLFEHEIGRKYVRLMCAAFERYKLKDASATDAITQNAQNYIALLTDHIDKENNILFAMADDRLSQKDNDELLVRFEAIEESRIGGGKHEEFHNLLHKLAGTYLNEGE